jgi:hypothetical protein
MMTQKKGETMPPIVPVQIEDANIEVMARIVKAASRKYGCDVEIDFSNGFRKVVFTGNEDLKEVIFDKVLSMFEFKEGDASVLY